MKLYQVETVVIGHDGCEAVVDLTYVRSKNAVDAIVSEFGEDWREQIHVNNGDAAEITDFEVAERPGYVTAKAMSRVEIEAAIEKHRAIVHLLEGE